MEPHPTRTDPNDDLRTATVTRVVWSAAVAAAEPAVRRRIARRTARSLTAQPDAARAVLRSMTDRELAALVTDLPGLELARLLAAATDARRYAPASSRDILRRVLTSTGRDRPGRPPRAARSATPPGAAA